MLVVRRWLFPVQATFDEYLTHSDRVFEAFFPDKERCAKVGKVR